MWISKVGHKPRALCIPCNAFRVDPVKCQLKIMNKTSSYVNHMMTKTLCEHILSSVFAKHFRVVNRFQHRSGFLSLCFTNMAWITFVTPPNNTVHLLIIATLAKMKQLASYTYLEGSIITGCVTIAERP